MNDNIGDDDLITGKKQLAYEIFIKLFAFLYRKAKIKSDNQYVTWKFDGCDWRIVKLRTIQQE